MLVPLSYLKTRFALVKGSEFMAVLTEISLRSQFFKNRIQDSILKLPKGTILTPSAKSYLNEKKINVQFVDKDLEMKDKNNEQMNKSHHQHSNSESPSRYRLLQGGFIDEKPEHMTALHSNILVYKDHDRIKLRGKLDSLESKIIASQLELSKNPKLTKDLSEVLNLVKNILKSEVLGEPLPTLHVIGLNEKEIRDMSHHPKKYFGIDHFYPDYTLGKEVVILNTLRTNVRETELAAYQAFKKEDGGTYREDIILALNRLSSLIWIMMFKCQTDDYKTEEKEG